MTPEQEIQKLLDDLDEIERGVLGSPAETAEVRRILDDRKAALLGSVAHGPDRFNEWSIKRLERRYRRLLAAVSMVALLSVAVAAWGMTRPATAPPAVTAAQMSAVQGEISELQQTIDSRLETLDNRMRANRARAGAFKRELRAVRRCTNRSITTLDRGLRRLLNRSISARQWVARRPLGRC